MAGLARRANRLRQDVPVTAKAAAHIIGGLSDRGVAGCLKIFRKGLDHPLVILGKRSLPVFVAGTVMALAAQVMKFINPGGSLPYDASLLAAGIATQFALAYYLEWLSGIGWSGKEGGDADSTAI